MNAVKESIQGSQKRARTAAAKPLPHKALKPEVADKLGNAADDIDIEDIAFFTAQEAIQIRQELLAWYDKHHRVLPWRRNPHSLRQAKSDDKYHSAALDMPQQQFAYCVWICEVMSQQTQVSRVAEYFTRWIQKWPTVQDLANATQEEVNDMWAGLGYYRRARLLLEGAQHIQTVLSGQMPLTATELQKIPGIGPYTGNAIASIGGNQCVAVVDANVVRVLARLRKLSGDQKSSGMVKLNTRLADALVDPVRPGCFNQAMMELGACICTVHQPPACGACPIQMHCQAYKDMQEFTSQGGNAPQTDAPVITQYPSKAVKAPRRKEDVAVCVIQLLPHETIESNDSRYLLVQRPSTGLLAGLWEFPSCTMMSVATDEQPSQQEVIDSCLHALLGCDSLQDTGSMQLLRREHLGSVVHTFSHIQQTMHVELLTFQVSVVGSKRSPFATIRRASSGYRGRCRADSNSADGKQSVKDQLGDEVLRKLKEAEQEAASLREQLAEAKAKAKASGDTKLLDDIEQQQEQTAKQISRITGTGMRREGLFGGGDESWLKEADMDFFARGPSETADAVTDAASSAVVQRRLLIGIGLTGAAVALALVPTAELRGKPSKPLFFYLTPLVRIQQLLIQAQDLASNGNWTELESLRSRIQGQPNSARENLIYAFSCLEDKGKKTKAERIAFDLLEYLDQINYNKYYESMGAVGTRGGEKEKLFSDFSSQSIKAAQGKLKQFMALMPADDLEAANVAANGGYF
ncbi:hypothetical protein WJX82_001534 [Trebouxia sp. C0006]